MAHTVGEIARLAGVTVRTLHHYDEIGLLTPSARTDAGYRPYDAADVARLQQILFYRELGLPLEEIAAAVADPEFDRCRALQKQREQLVERAEHLLRMVDAVDAAISAEQRGTTMSTDDMLAVFGDFDPAMHEAETEDRWGHTEAFRESKRRTAAYTRADWERHAAQSDEIHRAFADLKDQDTPPDSEAAMDVAERHRALISKWFYPCPPDVHVGLGLMYAADTRFAETIDRAGEGVAAYMSEAIAANGARRGV